MSKFIDVLGRKIYLFEGTTGKFIANLDAERTEDGATRKEALNNLAEYFDDLADEIRSAAKRAR